MGEVIEAIDATDAAFEESVVSALFAEGALGQEPGSELSNGLSSADGPLSERAEHGDSAQVLGAAGDAKLAETCNEAPNMANPLTLQLPQQTPGKPLAGVRIAGNFGSSPIDNRQRPWGTSWSPGFPTDRQLVCEVDALLRERERMRIKVPALGAVYGKDISQGDGIFVDSNCGSHETSVVGVSRGKAHWNPRTSIAQATGMPAVGGSGSSCTLPGLSQSFSTPSCAQSRRHHDLPRFHCNDGQVKLQGVHSTGDLNRYAKGIDVYSREGFEVRKAFKSMRSSEHAMAARSTWKAFHSFQASELSFEDWYATAKFRARYQFR